MSIKYSIVEREGKKWYFFDISISFNKIISALSKVDGYKAVLTERCYFVDDYYHEFLIDGYCFELYTPLGEFILEPKENVPTDIYLKVERKLNVESVFPFFNIF